MAGAESVRVRVDDGRHLAATVRGDGHPTVVCEAGMGAGQSSWALVAPAVAARTRVITYDRAGFGDSDPDPMARTSERVAEDLTALLRELGNGPAILVGHSFGGLIVRQAAASAPDLVSALVLVDPTDEGCDLYFDPSVRRQQRAMARMLPALGRTGALWLMASVMARDLTRADRRAIAAESGSVTAARAHRSEAEGCDADLDRLRVAADVVPQVPLTVISGTRRPRGRSAVARRDCLVVAHERRAAAAPQGRHVRAQQSEHLVMFTEPALVVDEILRLVDGSGG